MYRWASNKIAFQQRTIVSTSLLLLLLRCRKRSRWRIHNPSVNFKRHRKTQLPLEKLLQIIHFYANTQRYTSVSSFFGSFVRPYNINSQQLPLTQGRRYRNVCDAYILTKLCKRKYPPEVYIIRVDC